MAEIQLIVHPKNRWQDGQILNAFNDARIRRDHCILSCFEHGETKRINGVLTRRLKREKSDGLLPLGDVAQDFCDATHESKAERTGRKSCIITRISDGETIRIDGTKPVQWWDGRMVAMDVEAHFAARDKHGKKGVVFGCIGRECWYGGKIDFSPSKIESVVPKIRTKLEVDLDESQFCLWPCGRKSIREFLVVRTEDFTDEHARQMCESHQVDWRERLIPDLDETVESVLNREYPVGVDDVPLCPGRSACRSKDQPRQKHLWGEK
jgi:hypothetical protein